MRKVYDNELLLPGGETGTSGRIRMHEHHDDPRTWSMRKWRNR